MPAEVAWPVSDFKGAPRETFGNRTLVVAAVAALLSIIMGILMLSGLAAFVPARRAVQIVQDCARAGWRPRPGDGVGGRNQDIDREE